MNSCRSDYRQESWQRPIGQPRQIQQRKTKVLDHLLPWSTNLNSINTPNSVGAQRPMKMP